MTRAAEPANKAPAPPLPMLRQTTDPGGWRQVSAPGGYECWYFDAESHDRRTVISAAIFDGFPFHPDYIQRYRRFVRAPTRRPPPAPAEYPVAYFAAYHQGLCIESRIVQYEPGSLWADRDRLSVNVGDTSLEQGDDGAIRLELHLKESDDGPALNVALAFQPLIGPLAQELHWGALQAPPHYWLPCAPQCAVEGMIDFPQRTGFRFAGSGYHDHRWGTEPLANLRLLLAGRLLEGAPCAFQLAEAPGDPGRAQAIIFEAGNNSAKARAFEIELPPAYLNDAAVPAWMPGALEFDGVLQLRARGALLSSPVSAHMLYDAVHCGRRARAIAHGVLPYRLGWPFVRGFVEAAIQRPALQQE